MPATVISVEYDPNNRSANIALVQYEGERSTSSSPISPTDGDVVVSGEGADKPGNALFIKDIPVGTLIHNIEIVSWKGRSACKKCR